MNSKNIRLIAIIIILLMVTSIVSALDGINIYQVNWNNPHQRGTSTWVTAYINNGESRSVSGVAILQLLVPDWYTRTFQQNFSISESEKQQSVQINFTIDKNWPTGNYKARIYIPSFDPDGLSGTVIIN